MGGGALPPVPDWKSYQVGSHTPELEKVQRMLKSMGLKVGEIIHSDKEVKNFGLSSMFMLVSSPSLRRQFSKGVDLFSY